MALEPPLFRRLFEFGLVPQRLWARLLLCGSAPLPRLSPRKLASIPLGWEASLRLSRFTPVVTMHQRKIA